MADVFVRTRSAASRANLETVKMLLIFCCSGLVVSFFLMICGVDLAFGPF
jgi:hypothetical protein